MGDEVELYGEEYAKEHCAFYDLREICSIDPLLVEILKKPAGTLLRKLENGQWVDASHEKEGAEEEGYWVRVKDYTPQYSNFFLYPKSKDLLSSLRKEEV